MSSKNEKELSAPKLRVVVRPGEDDYFIAECLQLPGCMSQGRTEKEALENIVDAIESCLNVRLAELLKESPGIPSSSEAEETFRIKPLQLEQVTA